MPGLIGAADLTHIHGEQGYWASYSIPYFESIYNISGTNIWPKNTDSPSTTTMPSALKFFVEIIQK